MSAQILSGITVRDHLKTELVAQLASLPRMPELVIISVGNNPESAVYIAQKKKFGELLGVPVRHVICEENIAEKDLIDIITTHNNQKEITGIIVQLPLPPHINARRIADTISAWKDVDGLGTLQSGRLLVGTPPRLVSATARGIMSLLDYYKIDLHNKHVVVVGRSALVGRPVALLALERDATVTVCHSHTYPLENFTATADVLIVATGQEKLIGAKHVYEEQIVIDVGIHKTADGFCGDVDFDAVSPIVGSITPVPGGVGPLTVISLFQNLADAADIQNMLQS